MAGSMFKKAGSKPLLQEVVSQKVGFVIWKVGSRLRKPVNCTDLVKNCLTEMLDPEIVRNCTNLVRNSLTGRLDLHEFGKELPYRKAGSGNCTKLHEFGKKLPCRKAGSTQMLQEAVSRRLDLASGRLDLGSERMEIERIW